MDSENNIKILHFLPRWDNGGMEHAALDIVTHFGGTCTYEICTAFLESEFAVDDLKKRLQQAGVVNGIDEAELQKVIDDRMYNMPVKVAEGKKAVDGVDGWYEFLFQRLCKRTAQLFEGK